MGILERGENDSDGPSLNVRVYATEFAMLKKAILEFCDYMQNEQSAYKPAEVVPVDATAPSRGTYGDNKGFLVDCSRSNAWLLLRVKKEDEEIEEPFTVMDLVMDKSFPIYLAFHFDDIWIVRTLMTELEVYFNNQRVLESKIAPLIKRYIDGNQLHVGEMDEETENTFKRARCDP